MATNERLDLWDFAQAIVKNFEVPDSKRDLYNCRHCSDYARTFEDHPSRCEHESPHDPRCIVLRAQDYIAKWTGVEIGA